MSNTIKLILFIFVCFVFTACNYMKFPTQETGTSAEVSADVPTEQTLSPSPTLPTPTIVITPTPEVDFDKIEWIGLSFEGNEVEKESIKEYFKRAFDVIEEVSSTKEVPIAILRIDLNHDGNQEIIALLCHIVFHGAKDSGGLYVFEYDGKKVTSGRSIAGFPFNLDTISDPSSKQIGIIQVDEGWDKLFINDIVWDTEPLK